MTTFHGGLGSNMCSLTQLLKYINIYIYLMPKDCRRPFGNIKIKTHKTCMYLLDYHQEVRDAGGGVFEN
jgi:hypothetical protein